MDEKLARHREAAKNPATKVCCRPMAPPEPAASWTRPLLPVALALAGIVLLLDLISLAFGVAPAATLHAAAAGSWGTAYGVGQVLFKATPLIFTGLAFEVAFRAGLFNIGAEGQLALASLAAGWVGARLPPGTPWIVAVPTCFAVAAVVGALAALAPALMRARLGVHEIISTIMLNRIIDGVVPFALVALLGATSLRTADLVPGAGLPKLDVSVRAFNGSALSLAFPLAVLAAFALDAALRRTRAGREMRWTGQNPEACRAEGIDVPRRLVQAMLLSGALAGLGMSATVLGYKGYYELGLGAGAGFTGIAVALLGRGSPLGIVLSAVLFGTLQQAGLSINAHVPKEAMDVLTAAAIVLVAIANRQALRGRAAPAPAPDKPASAPLPGKAAS
jgi:simple sugar transport system permease protein